MTPDGTKPARDELGRLLPGASLNPGGPAKKTDEQRAAEEYLRDKTLFAAQKLVKLQDSDDEKIALGAIIAHLKMTIGEVKRSDGKNGPDPYETITTEELKALARMQLAKEKAH